MTQLTDPFISSNWGWDNGENGWGEGMNDNLIQYAFFHNRRINAILANVTLIPTSPADGDAYFVTDVKLVYFRANNSWHTAEPPIGMTFILKSTEVEYKYNGSNLVVKTSNISDVTNLQSTLDAKLNANLVGVANGVAPLGSDNKVPSVYLPVSGSYLGAWNASTNTPTITSSSGTNGSWYIVSVEGTTSINGVAVWYVGDQIRFNGTVWEKIPSGQAVNSVNGQTGVVVLTAANVGATPSSHIGSGGTQHADATTTTSGFFNPSEKIKLSNIANNATANQTDSFLLSRANHTGSQAQSTITGLVTDLASKQATLVSGDNIKTINGVSLLGSGNIVISGGSGSTTFTGLTDVPDSYVGNALRFVRIKNAEDGVEFVSLGTAAFNNTGDFATASHTHGNATTTVSGFMTPAQVTKLNESAPLVSPIFTGTVVLPSTTTIGAVSDVELGYLNGVVSPIQEQLGNKQPLNSVLTNTTASFSVELEAKLDSIAAGAEVNVNTDWNATSGDAQLLNKPTLGSSAALDVTTSNGDTTVNRVMKVGDAGWLSNTPVTNLPSLDLNQVNVSGVYGADSTILNRPTGAGNWLVLHLARTFENHVQMAIGRTSASRNLYIREQAAGVWGSWYKYFGEHNLLDIGTTATTARTALGLSAVASTGSASDLTGILPSARLSGTYNITNSGSSATLTTGRTIGMTGDVTWTSSSFNGSANVTGTATLSNSGVTAGTYGTSTQIPTLTIDSKGRVVSATTSAIPSASTTTAGVVQLVDSINSTSTTTSATPNSVKTAYDLAASRQIALGYTPVQQGTGIGQLGNTIKIGWSSTNVLKATVDITDIGYFVIDDVVGLSDWNLVSETTTRPQRVNVGATNRPVGIPDGFYVLQIIEYGAGVGTVINAATGKVYGFRKQSNVWTIYDTTPISSTTQAGIVQLSDSTSSTSTTLAATSNSVRLAYQLASSADSKGTLAINSRQPEQLFQSLGTISGSVNVSGSSGCHVLATAGGNISWTFPTPVFLTHIPTLNELETFIGLVV